MSGKTTVKKVLGKAAEKSPPPVKQKEEELAVKDTAVPVREDAKPAEETIKVAAETRDPRETPIRSYFFPVMGIPLKRKESSHTSSENEVIIASYVASNPAITGKEIPPSVIPVYERRKHFLMYPAEDDGSNRPIGRPSLPYTWRPVKVYHHMSENLKEDAESTGSGKIFIHERRPVFSESLVADGVRMMQYKLQPSKESLELSSEKRREGKRRFCPKSWDKYEIYIQLFVLGILIGAALVLAFLLRMCLNKQSM